MVKEALNRCGERNYGAGPTWVEHTSINTVQWEGVSIQIETQNQAVRHTNES